MYVAELNEEMQNKIREQLIAAGLDDEDIEIAMNSKVSDLEEIVKF